MDEKTNNVIHTQKNSQKFVENDPTDDIHDDHNFPIDELSGTNVETISTDHRTELKEESLYTKPPLNEESTPAKPKSIPEPIQPHYSITDHGTELKEDSLYTKPPLNEESTPAKPKSIPEPIQPHYSITDHVQN